MPVAEIFLAAFIKEVFAKFSSAVHTFARREGVQTAVKKLEETLMDIQAVLEDAEQKQTTEKAVQGWLNELRNLAYDVDDVLDEFQTKALRHEILAEDESCTSKVCLIPSCCTSFRPSSNVFKWRIESKIKKITTQLEDISKRVTVLGLTKISGGASTKEEWQRLPTTSLVDESSVYGRDKDKKEIIELMLRNAPTNNNEGGSVISIVGMGGLGKTALAQLVYNDDAVKQHFDLKAWVCVSDDFDHMKITKAILQSCRCHTTKLENLNQAQNKLKEALTGKRFLFVLDDVWNKNYSDWDALRSPFVAGEQGSKILVTTRNENVALMMGSVESYHLGQLSKTDCWLVFERHALVNRNIDANPKLKETGEKIVEKCRGLPLAVKTLAGLLRHKEDDEWEDILNSNIWDIQDEGNDILPALRLSYYHLPAHLKQCFAYFSILLKDYEFEEKEIVFLWMAEGFLQQPEGRKQMEDIGGKYFRELLSRSFFQQSNSNKSLYVMHDLINDLAQWVAGEICFKMVGNEQCKISHKARHTSYIAKRYDSVKIFEAFYEVKGLRTFLPQVLGRYGWHSLPYNVPLNLLSKLTCLRVLSLSGYYIYELPDSIGDLIHLRYLDLSRTYIKILPESIITLYNLQTLKLEHCSRLEKLPTKMRNLINLRHLDITNVNSIKRFPPQIGMLTSLQTLPTFVVGKSSDSGIRELGKLKYLRGRLTVSRLENVINAQEAQEANLNDKEDLDLLQMEWSSNLGDNSRDAIVEMDVLRELQPHKNLKQLTIWRYGGTRFPTWVGHPSFSNMVLLRLEYCQKCRSLPSLGQLPSLKDLCISGMNGVNSVSHEFYGEGCPKLFPSLETLKFENMEKWEKWVPYEVDRQVEVFPCLRKLSIWRCPKLSGELPDHLPSLEELSIWGNRQFVVSIPSLPKLCKLYLTGCKEVVQNMAVVDLRSLKSITLRYNSNLACLTEGFFQSLTEVEHLEIAGGDYSESTCLWLQHLTSLRHLGICKFPKFVSLVGEEAEQQQQQLGQLEVDCKLESLELTRCDNLEKLHGLQSLTSLVKLIVELCPRLVSFPETGLPSTLKELTIKNCDALKSLPWAMMPSGQCASLEDLFIARCESLTSIARGQLPSTLKKLRIIGCDNLQSLVDEEEEEGFISSSSSHNSSASFLEELSLRSCPSLTSLSSRGELPATLKYLSLSSCTRLETVAERFHNNTSLETISIEYCESLISLPEALHNLFHLSRFEINHCESLVSFPDGGLPATNLKKLSIYGCRKLEALPDHMHNLTSLDELNLVGCRGIESFPEEGFPPNLTSLSLLFLRIRTPLSEWGLHRLTSLRELTISDPNQNLVSFPVERMMLPRSLTKLSIDDFPSLKYLSSEGFRNLTSLEKLSITGCPKIKSFPKEGLPPSLLQLVTHSCAVIKQRCKKGQGREWPKISHIPDVLMDNRSIFEPEDEKKCFCMTGQKGEKKLAGSGGLLPTLLCSFKPWQGNRVIPSKIEI